MKALFLLLVLANLAVLAWSAWIVPDPEPPFVEGRDLPRLRLVGEQPVVIAHTDTRFDGNAAATGASLGEAAASTGDPAPVASPEGTANDAHASDATALPVEETPPATDPATATVRAEPPPVEAEATSRPPPTPAPDRPLPVPTRDTAGEVVVALAGATPRCVSLGPFLDLTGATDASAALNMQGLEPSQRLAESQIWVGHWVYLPPHPSRAAAVEVVEGLREQGVTDIYIEPGGEMRHAVSLGLFSERAHAETRAGRVRRLGVRPAIRDRYRDSSVYWVDFELPPDTVVDPAEFQSSTRNPLRIEGRECS